MKQKRFCCIQVSQLWFTDYDRSRGGKLSFVHWYLRDINAGESDLAVSVSWLRSVSFQWTREFSHDSSARSFVLIDGVPVHGTELLQCKPTSAQTSLKLEFIVELSWVRQYILYSRWICALNFIVELSWVRQCILYSRWICALNFIKLLNYKICKIFGLYNYVYQAGLKTILK